MSRFQLIALATVCLLFSLSCCSFSVLTLGTAPPCPHTELCFVLYGWSRKSHHEVGGTQNGAAQFRRARLCSLYCWGRGYSDISAPCFQSQGETIALFGVISLIFLCSASNQSTGCISVQYVIWEKSEVWDLHKVPILNWPQCLIFLCKLLQKLAEWLTQTVLQLGDSGSEWRVSRGHLRVTTGMISAGMPQSMTVVLTELWCSPAFAILGLSYWLLPVSTRRVKLCVGCSLCSTVGHQFSLRTLYRLQYIFRNPT